MNFLPKTARHIALIGVFALIVMMPAFYCGIPSSNDFFHHFQLADIFHAAIGTGDFYPSLASEANNGYGDFTVRFYPPFSYYFLSVFFAIFGDWYCAALAAFFLIFFAGGVGAYFLGREYFSAEQSLITAAIYVFAPYHISQIYNDFFYAEFAATAILPFCFLYVTRVARRGKYRDVIGLAASYSLLILTHLPLTVIGSLALGIYALFFLKRKFFCRTITKLLAAVFLALISSSFYWLRMTTEINWMNLSVKSFYAGTFDYRESFLLVPQNILDYETDVLCLWFADLMLVAVILISLPSLVIFFRERKEIPGFLAANGAVLLAAIFMETPPSKFVWENLTFLQNVQFPWRWLAIVSISGAVFATFGIARASEILKRGSNLFLTIGIGFVFAFFVFTSAFVVKQAIYIEHSRFDISKVKTRDFDRFWWTIWAKTEARTVENKAAAENRNIEILKWKPTARIIKIANGEPQAIRVAAFYYPYWHAAINGSEVRVEKTDGGLISIDIPGEESIVELNFREPPILTAAKYFSCAVWIFFVLFLIGSRFKFASKRGGNFENL